MSDNVIKKEIIVEDVICFEQNSCSEHDEKPKCGGSAITFAILTSMPESQTVLSTKVLSLSD